MTIDNEMFRLCCSAQYAALTCEAKHIDGLLSPEFKTGDLSKELFLKAKAKSDAKVSGRALIFWEFVRKEGAKAEVRAEIVYIKSRPWGDDDDMFLWRHLDRLKLSEMSWSAKWNGKQLLFDRLKEDCSKEKAQQNCPERVAKIHRAVSARFFFEMGMGSGKTYADNCKQRIKLVNDKGMEIDRLEDLESFLEKKYCRIEKFSFWTREFGALIEERILVKSKDEGEFSLTLRKKLVNEEGALSIVEIKGIGEQIFEPWADSSDEEQ